MSGDKVQSLPFGDDVAPAAPAPTAQIVETHAGRTVLPCLDADDPDADLNVADGPGTSAARRRAEGVAGSSASGRTPASERDRGP